MSILPSMMESSRPEYRPEPFTSVKPLFSAESFISFFTSIFDSPDAIESQVSGGHGGTSWPIKTFNVKLESTGEIIFMLATAFFCLWWCLAHTDFRRGLFIAPLPLWAIFHYLRSLARKISPDWHDKIRLDVDQLFHDCCNNFDRDGIRYEQICAVKLAEAKSKTSSSVEINYYPYADHTGALNLTRLKSRRLPVTEDNEGLYNELKQRAFGLLPGRQAQIKFFIWQVGRVPGGIFLYAFILSRIGR